MILMFIPSVLRAQKIDSMMRVYADQFPQEKAYLQFDKNVYLQGEIVWFKAYLYSGIEPSPISRNFYAELTDPEGNIIQRCFSPIFESTSHGSMVIPKDYKGNHVHFRAYTSWMLNFDSAFLFEKDIRIVNPARDSIGRAAGTQAFLQFFPEGGDLIAGLENNVAFKANDQFGLPVRVKGVLKDRSGKDVLEFSAAHDGMGKFLIVPDKVDSFYAVWQDEKGIEHKTGFPQVKPDGVVLRLMDGNRKIFFSIARSEGSVNDNARLTIIGHMNQQLVYKATVNLGTNPMSGGSIPTDQLPSGLLQVTIFNNNNLPVAERVIFVNNHEYGFTPDLRIDIKGVIRRGKNSISIEAPDTLKTNLSIAVTDYLSDGKKAYDDNIISRLLLTGDLKGFVYDAYYYFSNNSDSTKSHLDLVMLTHGWRRFKWDQLAKGKTPVIKYPEQDFLSINAELLGIDPSKISADEGINIVLKKKDSSMQMLALSKLKGSKFGLSGLVFYDTARAYYQFNNNRRLSNEAAVIFSNGLFKGYRQIKLPSESWNGWVAGDSGLVSRNKFVIAEASKNNDPDNKKVQTLASVTVKARQKSENQKLDDSYTSGLFSGGDAIYFNLVDDVTAVGSLDIFTYLQAKVAGLMISTNAAQTSLSWRGSTPTLYLNEMQVTTDQMKNTSVADVAMIKVFRPGVAIGFGGGAGGTIAVYTKKGGEHRYDPSFKGLDQTRVFGYSAIRQFYSPDYTEIIEASAAEDIRTTLYWNPMLLTDKSTRKISLDFFNNDISGKLRVVLEGINADGKMARVEKIIQ
jgi:hypothetical protein